MRDIEKEIIICAAIWYEDLPTATFLPINIEKGIVICGHRHGHCIDILNNLSNLRSVTYAIDGVGHYVQGFLTNTNKFVNREKGAEIARNAEQVPSTVTVLYSEDLY